VKSATRPQAAPVAPEAPPPGEADEPATQGMLSTLPATLPPEELLEIGIAPEMVTRYTALKKKKALAADPRTIYCPRQWCQAPSRASVENVEVSMKISGNRYWLPDYNALLQTIQEQEQGEDKKSVEEMASLLKEKLQVCSACSLAFCQKCLGKLSMNDAICYHSLIKAFDSIMARRLSDLQTR